MECIIAVENRGDLETRMHDNYDFFEVAIWEIKKALTEAYEAGKATTEKQLPPFNPKGR